MSPGRRLHATIRKSLRRASATTSATYSYGTSGLRPRTVPDDVHPERPRAVGDGAADAAEADDAERLAADAAAEGQRSFQPLAAAHEAFGEHDLARRRQHHADGEVGAFVGEDSRRVGHGDVALARGGEVDRVDADAEARR